MNRETQPSVCQFCNAEIKLTDDEWAIQSPYGTLPGHVCAKCAPDTVSGANRKKGYKMFVSRRAMKPNAHLERLARSDNTLGGIVRP